MDYEELDKKLMVLNESELKYRDTIMLSSYYNKLALVKKNGIECYLFDFNNDEINYLNEKNKDFYITKHSRFSPVPTHFHTYLELSYIYSGECEQIINNEKVLLKKGQICIIDTNTPHSISPTRENDIMINITMSKSYFSTAFFNRFSSGGIISEFLLNAISNKQSDSNYIIFNSQDNKKIPLIFKELLCEYFDKSICSKDIIDSYMIIIFSELLKVFQSETTHIQSSNNKNPVIEILKYIEENYKDCTLNSTATHFNFHPNYLSALIKTTTNQTFKSLVQTQKLKSAALLLSSSSLPISEIANNIGYNNLSFFYKKFKDYYGMLPKEYRKIHFK